MDTVTSLSNSVMAQYREDYLDSVAAERLYDQLAIPVDGDMEKMKKGSSVNVPFLSRMKPGTTAIPETTDITPQSLEDAVASITPTSRGEALMASEKLMIQAYTDYGKKFFSRVGENAAESIDILARDAACQGSLVSRYTARASLDAGTSAHRASDAIFGKIQAKLLDLKAPGFKVEGGQIYPAIMHPYVFHDIRESGNVDSIGLYQDMGIHLNWELGKIGNFRLVVHPEAKVFMGAGADNGTNIATTLSAAVSPLAKTIDVASGTSIAAGMVLTIGTEETGDTHYSDNERVEVVAVATNTLTIVGAGENGGLKYAHASGTAVRNADSVYTIVFGGNSSLVKLFAPEIGEFGQVLPPERTGLLKHLIYAAWKFYGGYARIAENRIFRGEYSTSYEA